MLYLLFTLGASRYALDAPQIAEILPLAMLKEVPAAPPWVAGLLPHRGRTVPVIDLNALAVGRPAQQLMSTRLVLAHYPEPGPGSQLLGILVEQATGTLRAAPDEFTDPGLQVGGAPWLGPVKDDAQGMIQRVRVADLLTPEVRALLFPEAQGGAAASQHASQHTTQPAAASERAA